MIRTGSFEVTSCSTKVVQQVTQVRYRRTLAYPFYSKAGNIPEAKGKKTVFTRLMKEFLGPKNYKGEYFMNKYSYVNQNHATNYIDPQNENGQSLLPFDTEDASVAPQLVESENGEKGKENNGNRSESNILESLDEGSSEGGFRRVKNPLQPFPANRNCFTNVQISKETKKQIVNDIIENKLPSQNVALKYGLKIQRIEAIVKLDAIEQEWLKENKITPELTKMSEVLYKMFPLYDPKKHSENLTEIPIPEKTAYSRFLTIAESQPFGPVDAAKEFDLEPAAITLQKLSESGEHAAHTTSKKTNNNNKDNSFIAPMYEGQKVAFKFTDVKVGKIGFRYGKSFRDNRRDRKIGYDAAGKMVLSLE